MFGKYAPSIFASERMSDLQSDISQVRDREVMPFYSRTARLRQFLQWFFRNRETGAITIAQAPNLALWIVIAASVLTWAWHPPGRLGVALEVAVKGGLFVWAIDEVLRGVNPWRRCLGAIVLGYELTTVL